MLKLSFVASAVALSIGVTLMATPITRAVTKQARADAAKARADYIAANPAATEADISDGAFDAYVASIAKQTITGWDGVGDADGNPVPATPDNIDLFLSLEEPFDVYVTEVINPALGIEDEKNGSAPSSTGSTAASTSDTAKTNPGTSDAPATNIVEDA